MARKCTYCRAEIPRKKDCNHPAQVAGFCSYDHMSAHGLDKARKQRERQQREETRKAKERVKTKREHLDEAQTAFNAYIRERDRDDPCISCGRHHQGQYHAGHYRSRGACPELRFSELNCHKQCAPCNNHKSGNVVEYRINLVRKIGQENVEWLEGKHEPCKYTIEDAKRIKAEYRQKLRDLKSNRNN